MYARRRSPAAGAGGAGGAAQWHGQVVRTDALAPRTNLSSWRPSGDELRLYRALNKLRACRPEGPARPDRFTSRKGDGAVSKCCASLFAVIYYVGKARLAGAGCILADRRGRLPLMIFPPWGGTSLLEPDVSILNFRSLGGSSVDLLAKLPRVIITTRKDPKSMLEHACTTQQCTSLA